MVPDSCAARANGFSLHAGLVVPPGQRERLERVCRYVLRPPVAIDRLHLTDDGRVSRRAFVVLGDEGIHAHVGQEFWDAVAAAMSARFRAGDFTGGLVLGISEAGRRLAVHFPSQRAKDRSELSDEVDFSEEPPRS